MNDEPPPSPDTTLRLDDQQRPDTEESDISVALREKKARYKRKRLRYLDDIVSSIDALVLTQLFVIYYLDNLTFCLLFRGFVQSFYLTPRPALFPHLRKRAPYLGAIFISNFFCALRHSLSPLTRAGESARGYLHGGLIIDFVGQRPASSAVYLLVLDFVILGLQLVMLSARVKRERLERYLSMANTSRRSGNAGDDSANGTNARTYQNYDAEERGVRLREEIEASESRREVEVRSEAEAGDNLGSWLSDLDSGEAVVARLYLFDLLRDSLDGV